MVLKRVFRDNVVIFRRRSKRITFLESVNFSTRVCVLIFNFRHGDVNTFWHNWPISAKCLIKTLQTSKRHTFRVSAFHRYHWFGVKLFPEAVRRTVERYPKNAKNDLFWIWLRPRCKSSEFFTIAPVLTATLTVCRRNRGNLSTLYRTFGALQVLQKHCRSGLAWVRPHANRGLSRLTSVFGTTIGVCKVLCRSIEIWQFEGEKPILE